MTPVTVVTVTWNAAGMMDELASGLAPLCGTAEVLVSDNASTDGTPALVREALPGARVVENRVNGGFGYGNNRALERVSTPYVLLLNPDARLAPEVLERLLETLASHPGAAAVQPLVRLSGRPMVTLSAGTAMTRLCRGYDMDFMHFQPSPLREVAAVPGVSAAAALFRTEALRSVAGFDETFFMYFEDTDLSVRLSSSGWELLLDSTVTALHEPGSCSDRARAVRWELTSSCLLARKILGGMRTSVPADWLRAELLSALRRSGGPVELARRLAAIASAAGRRVEPQVVPGEVLAELCRPRPMRMPRPRPPATPPERLAGGAVRTATGFLPGRSTGEWGFGCLDVRPEAGRLALGVRSAGGPGTTGLWRDGGLLDRVFLTAGGEGVLAADTAGTDGRLYLVPDRAGDRVKVTDATIDPP